MIRALRGSCRPITYTASSWLQFNHQLPKGILSQGKRVLVEDTYATGPSAQRYESTLVFSLLTTDTSLKQ